MLEHNKTFYYIELLLSYILSNTSLILFIVVCATRYEFVYTKTDICFLSATVISFVFWLIIFLYTFKLLSKSQNAFSFQQNIQPTVNDGNNVNFDKLIKYKELLDIGAITQEEFDAKKKEILNL